MLILDLLDMNRIVSVIHWYYQMAHIWFCTDIHLYEIKQGLFINYCTVDLIQRWLSK